MPTTATGTPYTVRRSTGTGYGTSNLAVGDAAATATGVPLVIYCHGSGGTPDYFANTPAWQPVRDFILDAGGAFLEGAGARTDEAGKDNWGNTDARNAYLAYVAWADSLLDVGPIVVLGRSMGGLVGVWLYLRSPIASRCAGLIVNSGVQTISYGTRNDPVSRNRPSAQWFGGMATAYNAATYEDIVAASWDHDPMNFDPALWNGKKVLQLVGTADTSVPPETRGAYPLRALYAGRPALDLLDVRQGGDHSTANGSFLQVEPMVSFLRATAGLGSTSATSAAQVLAQTATGYVEAQTLVYTTDGWVPAQPVTDDA